MTRDARAALTAAGFSRRRLLKGSGALLVCFSAGRLDLLAQGARGGSGQLDSWIAIAADGRVTAYTGKCELGQGIQTAQVQLIAEELSVPVSRVRLIQCDTSATPDQGTTSGSQSHPTNFNERNLAQAGASAREALVQLAAARLAVAADQLAVADGVVSVRRDPSKRVTYGDLIGGTTFNVPLNPRAARKPAREWTVLGKPVMRVDMAAMATGELEYVQNVRVPGMLHGAVVRPPEVGATLAAVDERSVANLPGVVKVVVKHNFVGVVAQKPWQAMQAASKLNATWKPGPALPAHARFS
jgi:CO/xanthine dehydrogenase Mo-binding subunit